jgi:carbonic anhydrase
LRNGWIAFAWLAVGLTPADSRAQVPERAHDAWKTPWSYEGASGPEHWGDLDPDYAACKAGKEQSPIDIRHAEKSALPAIRFEYESGPLRIINNGHTAVRVDYAPGNGNFLIVGEERYQLTQFHFHRPSEEYVHGKPYDMVAHFMHVSSDGKVAGVAVLLKAGSANATIQQLWKYMPKTAGKEREIAGVEVDPAGLLPHETAYYTYMGSLTAPPCSEGVVWFVLKTPLDISAEQIDAFAKLYPNDVRPPQPLNGRIVKQIE